MTRVILFKQLKVEGFLVMRWLKQWPEAFKEMSMWIKEVNTSWYVYMWERRLKGTDGGRLKMCECLLTS